MRSRSLVAVALAAMAAVTLDGQAPFSRRPSQQPPSFRTRITMVPVDVRVVDRDGRMKLR